MAYAKAFSKRDRREADRLLSVVFAHMAFSNARDDHDREAAHDRFKDAVRALYRFVTKPEQQEKAEAGEKAKAG